jgi:hypothetical protein
MATENRHKNKEWSVVMDWASSVAYDRLRTHRIVSRHDFLISLGLEHRLVNQRRIGILENIT